VQINAGQHAVNDPAAAFFGFDGEALTWARTDMTLREKPPTRWTILNQLEIYINRWDGQAWNGPQALTGGRRATASGGWRQIGDSGLGAGCGRRQRRTSGMVIAVRLEPARRPGRPASSEHGPSGLNAQVSIARRGLIPERHRLAWTYDADGSSEALEDRRLQLAV
jgi:hypothetical protein